MLHIRIIILYNNRKLFKGDFLNNQIGFLIKIQKKNQIIVQSRLNKGKLNPFDKKDILSEREMDNR